MGPKKGSERSRGGNHGVNKTNARYEKWRYNGDFHQLPTFNQRVESEVMAKSRLAGCILKGYIAVKEERTMLGSMFRHIGGLMTNMMLALLIVTSANPEGTRARLEGKFHTGVESNKLVKLYGALRSNGLIDYETMSVEQREEVLNEMTEKFENYTVKTRKLSDEGTVLSILGTK